MTTPHPELETLAELAENPGEAEPSDVRAHVASCPQCTADVAALRGVRDTLRSLPPIPMPDAVAARLESAVRAAAAPAGSMSVLPSRSDRAGRQRSSGRRLPHFSAAAAVTVLVVAALGAGIGVMVSQGGNGSKSTASGSAAGLGSASVVTTSGSDYGPASIRGQVAALVLARVPGGTQRYGASLDKLATTNANSAGAPNAAPLPASAPAAAASSAASAPGFGVPQATVTASATVLTPTAPAPTAPGGPLASPSALQACIVALIGQPVTPILVDYALFDGKPATVLVLPNPATPSVLDVYVEWYTASCVTDGDVTFYATLPAAS